MLVDVTTTAVLRPALLNRTFSSFNNNLFRGVSGCKFRLVINVDLIGENCSAVSVIDVAKKYFNDIKINVSESPGFTKSVIWCWKNTKSDYVFHLEDDWLLLKHVNLINMISIMDRNKKLGSLRLSKHYVGSKPSKLLSDGFVIHNNKLSLNPSLMRGSFIRKASLLMDENHNPEKQLRVHDSPRGRFISKWCFGIYIGSGRNKLVNDIGRKWMSKTNFKKKTGFKYWESV